MHKTTLQQLADDCAESWREVRSDWRREMELEADKRLSLAVAKVILPMMLLLVVVLGLAGGCR